jgi:hypothetical protein
MSIPYLHLNTSLQLYSALHQASEVKNFTKTESCITVRVLGFHYEYHHLITYSYIIAFFLKILETPNVNTVWTKSITGRSKAGSVGEKALCFVG